MKIISCFDGISCGQLALNLAEISYEKYWAYEINRAATLITQKHFPNTIQCGDVMGDLPNESPDLILAGSPCTSLSRAGDGTGLDGSSKIFWRFAEIWKEYPGVPYIFENTPMKKRDQDLISEVFEREHVLINSNLFSAQNRPRLYWTNIPINTIENPCGLVTADILEDRPHAKYVLSRKALLYMNDFYSNSRRWNKYPSKVLGKSQTVVANFYKGVPYGVVITDPELSREVYRGDGYFGPVNPSIRRYTPLECERLQTLPDNYTDGVADCHRYAAVGNGWTVKVISHILRGLK